MTTDGLVDRLEDLLAQGRREEVVITLLRERRAAAEQLERLEAAAVVAGPGGGRAHRRPRDAAPRTTYRLEPARFARCAGADAAAGRVGEPAGARRRPTALAGGVPDARVVTLAGQGHVAMLTAPDLFAAEVLAFLRSPAGGSR